MVNEVNQLWEVVRTHREGVKLDRRQRDLGTVTGKLEETIDGQGRILLRMQVTKPRHATIPALVAPQFVRVVVLGRELRGLLLTGTERPDTFSRYDGAQSWWMRALPLSGTD